MKSSGSSYNCHAAFLIMWMRGSKKQHTCLCLHLMNSFRQNRLQAKISQNWCKWNKTYSCQTKTTCNWLKNKTRFKWQLHQILFFFFFLKVKLRHVWTRVKPEDDKTIAATEICEGPQWCQQTRHRWNATLLWQINNFSSQCTELTVLYSVWTTICY